MKAFAVALLCLATLLCLPLRPLWVDEIFQLEGTWQQSYPQMLHNAMVAPGGMPLAYAAQKLWLDAVGLSPTRARFPAALFGLGTVFLLFWIARLLNLYAPVTLLFGFCTPLLFRYATEARPYSQGLFFSVLSTALFLGWRAQPSAAKLSGYFLACLAGVYSQPFSLFLPCAHAAYLLLYDRKRLPPVLSVLTLTGLLYAPWVLASHRALVGENWPHEMFFSYRQVSPLMIIREISGGGFVCSIALLLLATVGIRKANGQLLTLCIVVPLAMAVAADAAFNYFFAIRQLIFIVPPLLLLATAGVMELWSASRMAAVFLAGLFVVGALVKDVRWQADWKEDWGKAAAAIQTHLDRTSGCVQFQPSGDARHYFFFDPGLKARTCSLSSNDPIALVAISPYAPASQRTLKPAYENAGNTLLVPVAK